MDIILYHDAVALMLPNIAANPPHRGLVKQILDNPNSKIIVSNALLTHLEKHLEPKLLDSFQKWYQNTRERNPNRFRFLTAKTPSRNFHEEFLGLLEVSQADLAIGVATDDLNAGEYSKRVCSLKNIRKLNRHWLLAELAVAHPRPVVVNSNDFDNDDNITSFLTIALSLAKQQGAVLVFDRFFNLTHDHFKQLAKFQQVQFYTIRDEKEEDFERKLKQISSKFPKAETYLVKQNYSLHGRNIVMGNLVVWSDNDFARLRSGKTYDWRIGIQLSPDEAKRFHSACRNFSLLSGGSRK